jgi:hypothetical protein
VNSSWFFDPHLLHAIFHLQRHHIEAGVTDCQSEGAGYYVRMIVSNHRIVKKQQHKTNAVTATVDTTRPYLSWIERLATNHGSKNLSR